MDGDEIEMSKEELQKWIREKVNENELVSADVLKKCDLLQSLLERKERQAAQLLKLCESVASFELMVKKQYSMLGLQYRDADSDDDHDISDCGQKSPSPCQTPVGHSPDSQRCSPLLQKNLLDRENPKRKREKKSSHTPVRLFRTPVVVLTRLPASTFNALCPPTSPESLTDDELSSSFGSDVQWIPDETSSDSDVPSKRRKMPNKTPPRRHTTAKASTEAMKASTSAANSNVSASTETPPGLPQGELSVNMKVLARRTAMSWQRGKVVDILTRDDGRVKYKVHFEERGKSLVSSHHIAIDCMPQLEHLFVGARVVVKCKPDEFHFCPGILAELPSRKNKMRFLVFTDDHTPAYVDLKCFHMVYKPLMHPLEDILDNNHKNFMKEYLKNWPYVRQMQYKVGELLNAELHGVQQECEVKVVDCSLIQVVFQDSQHEEWIYRGSLRLEHMIVMKTHLESHKANCRKI
ncbi:histone-lysine N-methyltransferase SETDB1-A-like isoform X2 [Echeneis naucrates]|uniref:histone-lysine N-methyltransferase SETDB1-A-like isoform X2 n=1 Tax=Echeneis naucrates TaxID=173247 RepID=UPI001113355C|nr:histone-lysine N-methyltransferase SETDB1-A-like isoform X2 [Echeneis naucrates]